MPKKITKEQEEEIIGLKKAGFAQKKIAKMTGLSDFTVKRVWRESKEKEDVPEPEPVSQYHVATVVRLVPNNRMVLAEIEGMEGRVRLIKKFGKPDTLGKKAMRCERIEDDLWRVVKL